MIPMVQIKLCINNLFYKSLNHEVFFTGLVLHFGLVFVKPIITKCNRLCCCSSDAVFIEGDKD